MIWRGVAAAAGVAAGSVASALAICGAMISNFPKTRLLFVRLSISGLRMSGIELLERIPLFVVVSLVESILLSR